MVAKAIAAFLFSSFFLSSKDFFLKKALYFTNTLSDHAVLLMDVIPGHKSALDL